MYSTCLFCNRSLGENEVIEHFPIGRRLAFDSFKGRLWVVCRRCERWNLTPLEERWEAVEECERLFETIRTRVSTENIGLARHPGGIELVRIGQPLEQEFAAWRYGDQFGRRRKKAMIYGVGGGIALAAFTIGGAATGAISGALLAQSGNIANAITHGVTRARVRTRGGKILKLKLPDLQKARFLPRDDPGTFDLLIKKSRKEYEFTGEDAGRVARSLMAGVNSGGGKRLHIQEAVSVIRHAGNPEQYLARLIPTIPEVNAHKRASQRGRIDQLPKASRLALEMALNEEQEQRALRGELAFLEAAWREAEELAEIEDNLLVPESTEEFIRTHRPDGLD